MRRRWRGMELPMQVVCNDKTLTESYGCFSIEPFERGYAHTIGNSLRRVLLSSLEGTAVTGIRIEGVSHEYATIPGVIEDVTNIILNIKQLLVKMDTDEPQVIKLVSKPGARSVAGADIECGSDVEVVNKDLHIATLSEDGSISIEMDVHKGRGYVTADENKRGEDRTGFIPIDSIFSPVLRVQYKSEDTRVGQVTNYNKLTLEIWTDSTIGPEIALVEASKILRKYLDPFIKYYEIGEVLLSTQNLFSEMEPDPEQTELDDKLDRKVYELDLSVRAANCLKAEGIETVRDLTLRPESDLMKVRNFGKTSLLEIKQKMEDMGMELGMFAENE